MLTVGSLFSGIGGFDLGFERAGMRTAWFVERDPFCRRVLAKHWPQVPVYNDIREVHATPPRWHNESCARCLPPVDVLCGGFPCQDISFAGKGAGITGERSGLWSEFARLIGELRPRYVVVENVPALRRRGLDVVLGDLAACGFDAEWDGIPASAVGAHHQRDRIWIVAYPNGEQHEGGGAAVRRTGVDRLPEQPASGIEASCRDHAHGLCDEVADANSMARPTSSSCDWRPEAGHGPEAVNGTVGRRGGSGTVGSHPDELADARSTRPQGNRDERSAPHGTGEVEPWAPEPDVGRVAYGVPNRVDRLRALGNALVPPIAEWIGHRIIEHERLT